MQQFEEVVINADGSVTGTSNIERDGDFYRLNRNIVGNIQVHKSNIIIDGTGYALIGNGVGRGIDLSNWTGNNPSQIVNVTVKNMEISGFDHGIDSMEAFNNSFSGNYVVNCSVGIWLLSSNEISITLNTFQNNHEGVHLDYSGKNISIIEITS